MGTRDNVPVPPLHIMFWHVLFVLAVPSRESSSLDHFLVHEQVGETPLVLMVRTPEHGIPGARLFMGIEVRGRFKGGSRSVFCMFRIIIARRIRARAEGYSFSFCLY
jgi:hypothetical protein